MKTMCPLGYHCNGFVATHALGHMMYIYIQLHVSRMFTIIRQIKMSKMFLEDT